MTAPSRVVEPPHFPAAPCLALAGGRAGEPGVDDLTAARAGEPAAAALAKAAQARRAAPVG